MDEPNLPTREPLQVISSNFSGFQKYAPPSSDSTASEFASPTRSQETVSSSSHRQSQKSLENQASRIVVKIPTRISRLELTSQKSPMKSPSPSEDAVHEDEFEESALTNLRDVETPAFLFTQRNDGDLDYDNRTELGLTNVDFVHTPPRYPLNQQSLVPQEEDEVENGVKDSALTDLQDVNTHSFSFTQQSAVVDQGEDGPNESALIRSRDVDLPVVPEIHSQSSSNFQPTPFFEIEANGPTSWSQLKLPTQNILISQRSAYQMELSDEKTTNAKSQTMVSKQVPVLAKSVANSTSISDNQTLGPISPILQIGLTEHSSTHMEKHPAQEVHYMTSWGLPVHEENHARELHSRTRSASFNREHQPTQVLRSAEDSKYPNDYLEVTSSHSANSQHLSRESPRSAGTNPRLMNNNVAGWVSSPIFTDRHDSSDDPVVYDSIEGQIEDTEGDISDSALVDLVSSQDDPSTNTLYPYASQAVRARECIPQSSMPPEIMEDTYQASPPPAYETQQDSLIPGVLPFLIQDVEETLSDPMVPGSWPQPGIASPSLRTNSRQEGGLSQRFVPSESVGDTDMRNLLAHMVASNEDDGLEYEELSQSSYFSAAEEVERVA